MKGWVLLGLLALGGCQVSPKYCDPKQSYPGQSVICQKAYERRLETAQSEHWQAAEALDRAKAERQNLSDQSQQLDNRLVTAKREVEELTARAQAVRLAGNAPKREVNRLLDRLEILERETESVETSISAGTWQHDANGQLRLQRLQQARAALKKSVEKLETW